MTNGKTDISLRQAAIVSGVAILLMAVIAVLGTDLSLNRLIVPGDEATTVANIKASQTLFRAGIGAWLAILICDVLAAWGLYIFFRPVNRGLSLLMAWLRLIYAAILGASLLNLVTVILLVTSESYTAVFSIDQVQAQARLFLDMFDHAWSIGLVVFGLHILALGYLVIKSRYAPKVIGVVLVVAFFGYLVTNLGRLVLPNYDRYGSVIAWTFVVPEIVGEVGLALWLLIRGLRVQPEQ